MKKVLRVLGWVILLLPIEVLVGVAIWRESAMAFFLIGLFAFVWICAAAGCKLLDLAE